jgi:hypothetical protein
MRRLCGRIGLGLLSAGLVIGSSRLDAAGPFQQPQSKSLVPVAGNSTSQSRPSASRNGASNQEIVDLLVGALRRAGMPTDGMGISVQNGVVTLSGSVGTEYQRERGERIARSVQGVSRVSNRLQTTEPVALSSPESSKPSAYQARTSRPAGRTLQAAAPPLPPRTGNVESVAVERVRAPVSRFESDFPIESERPAEGPAEEFTAVEPTRSVESENRGPELEVTFGEDDLKTLPPRMPPASVNQAYGSPESYNSRPAQVAAPPIAARTQPAPASVSPSVRQSPSPMNYPSNSVPPASRNIGPQYGLALATPDEVPQVPRMNAARVMRATHAPTPAMINPSGPVAQPAPHGIVATGGQSSASAWPYAGSFHPYPQIPVGWRKSQLEWDDGYWQMNFRPRTERWWWYLDHRNWTSSPRTIE